MVPNSTICRSYQYISIDQPAPEPYGVMVCAHECPGRTCVPDRKPAAASASRRSPVNADCEGGHAVRTVSVAVRRRGLSTTPSRWSRMLRSLSTRRPRKFSATSNAAHRPDGHRRVGVDRNPPAGTIVIPSMPRKPSSNVAMNSAPCRCAAATIAASAKLNRAALRIRNSRSAAGKNRNRAESPALPHPAEYPLRRAPPDVHISRALPSRLRETRTRSTDAVRIRLQEGTPWRMRPPLDARRVPCGTR